MKSIKILFLADTHLGYDLPRFQRVKKRRLGYDFQLAYEKALSYAEREEVDFILHGGDVFYRALIKDWLIQQAYMPLAEIASKLSIPVMLVPGNHERSRLPHNLFSEQKNIYTFRIPSTFTFKKDTIAVSFSGFPCIRNGIRDEFKHVITSTGFYKSEAEMKFICMHQSVEGATVGTQNYTFRTWGKGGEDVIRMSDIPPDCAAVLSGHIHRQQILTHDLDNNKSPAPVIYPGSIQRTAYAERDEKKGFYIIEASIIGGRHHLDTKFVELYSSPMHLIEVQAENKTKQELMEVVINQLKNLPEDAIVKIKLQHSKTGNLEYPSLKKILGFVPPTMKISMNIPEIFKHRSQRSKDEPA